MQVLKMEPNLDVKLMRRKKKVLSLSRFKNEIQKLTDESSVLSFLLQNAKMDHFDYILLDDPIYVSRKLPSPFIDPVVIEDFLIQYSDDSDKVKENYKNYDKTLFIPLKDAFKESQIEFNEDKSEPISPEDEEIKKLESDKIEIKDKFVESVRGSDYLIDKKEAESILGLS